MSTFYWRRTEPPNKDADPNHLHEGAREVNEQHALPVGMYYTPHGAEEAVAVSGLQPLPTRLPQGEGLDSFVKSMAGDLAHRIAIEGRKFYASDGDQNDRVVGQTSFANTTPTFLLQNPVGSGMVVIPLFYSLAQTGTVAGGAIDIITELDVDRYSSSGTSETTFSNRPITGRAAEARLWSTPTATAGYGVRLAGITAGADVDTAEGALQEYLWTPTSVMDILDPGTCLKVFTFAGTTGPTWYWTFSWAEVPPEWLAY